MLATGPFAGAGYRRKAFIKVDSQADNGAGISPDASLLFSDTCARAGPHGGLRHGPGLRPRYGGRGLRRGRSLRRGFARDRARRPGAPGRRRAATPGRPHPGPGGRQAAHIQARAGRAPKAIGHLETAIQLAPSDADVWIQLAGLENGRENTADAYVAYRRAAELAPDDIRAVSGLALTADTLGFEDEARVAYARWAELERELDAKGPSGK
ncbi:MAG: tetratricopeptide repeat protein [Deltaproteobacteria bacterium]|nr:tetratricopeptide repeat protein [Deltaproteobacteria bacterium]